MSDKLLYSLARPLLFSLDAEQAHNLTLPLLRRAAALGLTKLSSRPQADPRTVMGITCRRVATSCTVNWPRLEASRRASASRATVTPMRCATFVLP